MSDEQGEQHQIVKKDSKTIYDVGLGMIILKNFFAGFSRAAGAVLVYLILLAVLYYFTLTYILPRMQDIIPTLIPSFDDLFPSNSTQTSPSGKDDSSSSQNVSPEQFNEAVKALKEYNSKQK